MEGNNPNHTKETDAPARRRLRLGFPLIVVLAVVLLGLVYQRITGNVQEAAGYFIRPVAYAIVGLAIAFLMRMVLDWFTPYNDTKLVVDNNVGPIGLQRGAIYAALFIGMAGSLMAPARSFGETLRTFSIDGLIMAAALIISTRITDLYLLRKINNQQELARGKWAVAFVEAGAYLSLGAILNGAFAGEGGGWLSGLEFFGIGQLTLFAVYMLYEWRTACNVDVEVYEDNRALALEVGGYMLAMGIVLRFAIVGPFTGWWSDIVSYAEALVPSLLVLALVMVLVDWWFLPRLTLGGNRHHGKVSASLIVVGPLVGLALVIGASLSTS